MSVKLRKKKLSDGRSSLYLDLYVDGKRKYEFLEIHTLPGAIENKEKLRQAEIVRAKRELEQSGDRFGIVTDHKKTADFMKYAKGYLESYGNRDIRMVKFSLRKFEEYLAKRRRSSTLKMQEVTPELCSGFRSYLMDPSCGLKGETPQNYFARFKRIIKAAMVENLILKDPTAGLSIRRTNEFHKEVLSQEEIKLLAQTPCGNDDVRRAFLFSCFTGVGLAEATELTLANIKGDRFWYVRKKTNKKVNLVLHNSARILLGTQLTKTEPVFKFPSSTAVNKCLQNWVERAGIEDKKITFYSARHSFATNLLRNGVNLKTVADCLGHTTVHHTVKYLHYVDGLKDEAVAALLQL